MSQFYALMHDNTVKYISLREEIIADIRNLFINGGAVLKPEGIEEDEFDGNIVSRNGKILRMSIITYQKILLVYQIIKQTCPNII